MDKSAFKTDDSFINHIFELDYFQMLADLQEHTQLTDGYNSQSLKYITDRATGNLFHFHFSEWMANNINDHLPSECRFSYMGSFGHKIIKNPLTILTDDSENALWISDCYANQIHKFDISGRLIQSYSLGLKNPRGLFKDPAGPLWICDFGHQRLLSIDPKGRIIHSVFFPEILGESFKPLHPLAGCAKGNVFFMIFTDDKVRSGKIFSFNDHFETGSICSWPLDVPAIPFDITCSDDQLFVGTLSPGILYVYDWQKNHFRKFSKFIASGKLRRVNIFNEYLFLCIGNDILKMNSDGHLVFIANPSQLAGKPILPAGIASLKQADQNLFFVGDFLQGCIHTFAV
jgi:hypothetical protein